MEETQPVPQPAPDSAPRRKRLDKLHVSLIVILVLIVAIAASYWLIRYVIFPDRFSPVTLSEKEERVLDNKLHRLGVMTDRASTPADLAPEAYREDPERRRVIFTEKELNALLARNTDLASRLAIDLSDDLISAKALIDMDEDFPILGGQTLKVKAGAEVRFENQRPVVILKGVSIMGVPLPNAWLGNLKHIDLVNEFGQQPGFWKSFADGIETLKVEDGQLVVKLKE